MTTLTLRWKSLLAALLVLGGATGCPNGLGAPCTHTPPTSSSQRVFGRDEVVDLTVSATPPGTCGATEKPRSVTVEVYDPENQPITAEAVLDGESARVRFTPTRMGRHHVIVAFEPVGSLQQFDVLVVEDQRDAPVLLSLPRGTSCTYVDRTARGTWLCGGRVLGEQGEPVQVLTEALHANVTVAGDVVWMLEGDRVRRYEDRGTGTLELTGTAPFPLESAGMARSPGADPRSATPEELVLVRNRVLYRYVFTEAGDVAPAPTTSLRHLHELWPLGRDSSGGAVLLRVGARLLVVGNNTPPEPQRPQLQACPYQLDAAGAYTPVPGESCQRLSGDVVGHERDVLWTVTSDPSASPAQQTLLRYSAASGRMVEQGVLEMNGTLVVDNPTLRPGPILPALSTPGSYTPIAMPRWNPETGLLDVVLVPDPGVRTNLPNLGARFLWMDAPAGRGGQAVYARPSTP